MHPALHRGKRQQVVAGGSGTRPAVGEAAETVAGLIKNPAPLNPLAVLSWPGVLVADAADPQALNQEALGLFEDALAELKNGRNREGAERRLATLTAAGFPAKLATSGTEVAASWWVDTATAGAATPASLQQRSAAAQQQSLDCARLR